VSPASLWKDLWGRCPRAIPEWARVVGRVAAFVSIPTMIAIVLSPLLLHPWTLGQRNWDQMNAQRYVVVKTLGRFHQFPFWDPWSCGGHAAWGAQESAPIVISPFLPAYLWLPLPIAIRVEILGWAVIGAAGAWMLARRFTRSTAVAAMLVLAFAVDSRWSLQVAVGHSWHLLYALLPWTLFFFDRAVVQPTADGRRSLRDLALAAACIALMVYGDAIYPVPHTAFVLVVYACIVARATRSWRPVGALAVCGALAVGLSAPKLLPLWEQMQRFPRYITSEEAVWPWHLPDLLTLRLGDYTAVSSWTVGMWHEWGLYLGWPLLLAMVAGVAASRGSRERAFKWAGLAMIVFVIGGFHALAPWRLLHLLPVFKSQHVPSRWLYPAVLVLGCAAASGAERLLGRAGQRRAFFEVLLGVGALACAIDMGLVAREPMAQSFVDPAPAIADAVTPFHVVHRLPPRADYQTNLWDVATLPGVMENVGTMECVTFAGYHVTQRDMFGRMPGLGAWGEEDPEYRGEAYVAEGDGSATIASWTPNEVVVTVRGARPGDHLVLNQNWDAGWTADGAPAVAYHDAVATTLGPGPANDGAWTVRFRYRPRTFTLGLALFGVTAAGIALVLARKTRAALLTIPLACLGCSTEQPRHVFDGMDVPAAPAAAASDPERALAHFPTARGDVFVTPLEHAGLLLGWDGRALYFDPTYGGAVTAAEAPPALDDATLPRADAIFLTDVHSDHFDPIAVSRLHENAVVVAPPALAERTHVDVVLHEGDTRVLAGIGVTAVPMYNETRGPAPGQLYHPRGRGDGYLLDLAGTRIYVSGDTDCTPEVRALHDVAVAIVAMDGHSTMSPGDAAACLLAMRPRVVIPYHDWGADLSELRRALDGSGIELRELPFYPRPERLRVRATRACEGGHWGRCIELLDLAQQLDPRSDEDPRVVSAREQARANLDTLPLLR
jgi:L-ascorbate metabolism protein UlaG (beta-lactamase superfamily)